MDTYRTKPNESEAKQRPGWLAKHLAFLQGIRWGYVGLAFAALVLPLIAAHFVGGAAASLIYGAYMALVVVGLALLVVTLINPPPKPPLNPEWEAREDGKSIVRRW